MSSEAITQNDLREILSRTVGAIPSEYKKLLWTNPSPTSAMASATIVASGADEYDAIEVVYKTAHIYNGYETALSPFVAGSHITLLAPSGTGGEFSGAIYNAVRTISMGAGGSLGVDDAVGMTSSGTSINNNMCIPYKVYGIKYERVAPPQLDASDYVIEQGISGIWTYRKWDSGIAECWGSYSSSVAITTAFGSWYYRTIGNIGFPSGLFISTPTITATKNGNANGLSFVQIYSVTSTGFTPEVANPISQTYDLTIAFHAIGKWK